MNTGSYVIDSGYYSAATPDGHNDCGHNDDGYGYTPMSRYPTSSARDEVYTRAPSFSRRHEPVATAATTASRLSATTSTGTTNSARTYVHAFEVSQGVLSNGTMTERHPLVLAFLSFVSRAGRAATEPLVASKSGKGKITLGRLVRRVVSDAVRLEGVYIDEGLASAIFTLAALVVFYHPRHPAHIAFWNREGMMDITAQLVSEVSCKSLPLVGCLAFLRCSPAPVFLLLPDSDPCPITPPVCWIGTRECLWTLRGYQSAVAPELFPSKKKQAADRMLLRKRKASVVESPETSTIADGQVAQDAPKRPTRGGKRVQSKAKAIDAASAVAREPGSSSKPDGVVSQSTGRDIDATRTKRPRLSAEGTQTQAARRSSRVARPTVKAVASTRAKKSRATSTVLPGSEERAADAPSADDVVDAVQCSESAVNSVVEGPLYGHAEELTAEPSVGRARSSSSSMESAGSSTAVSNTTASTVVFEETDESAAMDVDAAIEAPLPIAQTAKRSSSKLEARALEEEPEVAPEPAPPLEDAQQLGNKESPSKRRKRGAVPSQTPQKRNPARTSKTLPAQSRRR